MPRAKKNVSKRVKLRPEDPFDLIRLLARSQSDPRKALAELVQNSLDARAARVEVTWFNEKGRRALRLWDDGEGIFPELDREEALRRIARTIGHSHKRELSPLERREQMVLGQYGIGLIGFWSVAEVMEIQSRVAGGPVWCLRLVEDESQAEVYPSRARRIEEEETFTQVTLRRVHEGAIRQVRPTRLHAFLASELRGQLLERGTEVRLHDRVARGRAQKLFVVKPRPYLGVPLDDLRTLEVPGHEEARLELYLVSPEEGRAGTVSLACGGTTVLEDIASADPEDGARAPWSTGRIEGVIDFPDLRVAPSTRRGFVPDAAAERFLAALAGLERELAERLAELDRRRDEQRHQDLAKEIRRAFRPIAARLPEYELFDVRDGPAARRGGEEPAPAGERLGTDDPPGPAAPGEGGAGPTAEDADDAEAEGGLPELPETAELFPPGPLAEVRIQPRRPRLAPGQRRGLRARAVDDAGRRVDGAVGWSWRLVGAGELVPDAAHPDQATYVAPDDEATVRVIAVAALDGRVAQGEVEVRVLESLAGRDRASGIPDPIAVNAPGERWRSRLVGEAWEFNDAHPDYASAAAASEAQRLRYLVHLFAKEVVLRNFPGARADELLERMVQVITHLETGRRKA